MNARYRILPLIGALALALAPIDFAAAQGRGGGPAPDQSLAGRIAHTNPENYRRSTNVHGGAGPMAFTGLLSANQFESNLYFLHRGIIEPGGGIGHHFHNASEEMFVILSEGEAEFTINGRTSRIRTPAGVPNVMGSSHAIRNHTDQPLEWMNINVTAIKGRYDAFDLGDPRVDVPLDPIPVFMTMSLDRSRLRTIEGMHGGRGPVQYRRALEPSVFRTTWAYVDHLVVPPGSATGLHRHTGVEEFYYVMTGAGRITVNSESAAITTGDAIPIYVNEAHAVENTGSEPLELLIVGVAMDMSKNLETIDVAPNP